LARLGPKAFLYAGTVEATEVDVPSRLGTLIESYQVKEGETVSEGQTLVTLTGEDFKLARNWPRAIFAGRFPSTGPVPPQGTVRPPAHQARGRRAQNSWRAVRSPIAGPS
jgi:hypothetical protein